MSGDAFGDVFQALVQGVGALSVVGDILGALRSSYGSNCGRGVQFGFGADDLLDIEPEATQALSDPAQESGRLLLLFDDDVRAELHRDQALVGEPDVGTPL